MKLCKYCLEALQKADDMVEYMNQWVEDAEWISCGDCWTLNGEGRE